MASLLRRMERAAIRRVVLEISKGRRPLLPKDPVLAIAKSSSLCALSKISVLNKWTTHGFSNSSMAGLSGAVAVEHWAS